MKILITGSNGQLGSELRRILASGLSELGAIPVIFQGADIECLDFGELDITNRSSVIAYIEKSSPNVIINCAAYTNVDGSESNQDEAFRVNALGPRNLAIAAEQINARLVSISTDYVFAGDAVKPYREYDICRPQSVYGASKYLGEGYVRDFCSRYFIVRTSWLYGSTGNNFVKTIMKASRERGSLQVVNDQVGSPTNAADLAHHVLKIAATDEYGVYHCAGKGQCSWYDFAVKIIAFAGINATVSPCTSAEYPTKAKRPAYSVLDNMMLRCTVGDEMRDWYVALKSFLEEYNG